MVRAPQCFSTARLQVRQTVTRFLGRVGPIAAVCALWISGFVLDPVQPVRAATAARSFEVYGFIDGIRADGGDYYLYGWACSEGFSQSIGAAVYIGGPRDAGGVFGFSGMADLESEPAVSWLCNTSGTRHRFSLPIPAAVIQEFGGQTIYVHGVPPYGGLDIPLAYSGVFTIPGPAPSASSVIGSIDGIRSEGSNYYLEGWACMTGSPGSINVDVYLGGPLGAGGSRVFGGPADRDSEPEVSVFCNTNNFRYRFSLLIPVALSQYSEGQPIFAHGVAPLGSGLANNALANSGVFTIPAMYRPTFGWIDGLRQQGADYYIYGWACAAGYSASIDVQVYAGGAYEDGGTLVLTGTADVQNEPGVSNLCISTGNHHRYSLLIPAAIRQQYAGQPIYVHGVYPVGMPNYFLAYSGAYTIPALVREVTGWIEGVRQAGPEYYLDGWACVRGYPESIGVQLFLGGPSGGGGTLALNVPADRPSEPAVAASCGAAGTHYRFSILLSTALRQAFPGRPIYVHGVSPFGADAPPIGNSGTFIVPPLSALYTREYIYLGGRILAVETRP